LVRGEVGQGQAGSGGPGEVRAKPAPLIGKGRAAAGRDGERSAAALVGRLADRRSDNGRRSRQGLHRQNGISAGGAAGEVGDHRGIAAGIRELHIIFGIAAQGRPGHVHPVKPPLVGEWRRPGGGHRERDVRGLRHRLAQRLGDDRWRHNYGQRSVRTGGAAGEVGDHHRVAAGIARLHVVLRIAAEGRPGNAGPITPPLVGERRGAGGGHRKGGAAALVDRQALRLGDDRRRHIRRGIEVKVIADDIPRERDRSHSLRSHAGFAGRGGMSSAARRRWNQRGNIITVAVRLDRRPARHGHGRVIHIKPGTGVLDPAPHNTLGRRCRVAPRHGGNGGGARVDIGGGIGPPATARGRDRIRVGAVAFQALAAKIADFIGDGGVAVKIGANAREDLPVVLPATHATVHPRIKSAAAVGLGNRGIHVAVLQHAGPIAEIGVGGRPGEGAGTGDRAVGNGRDGMPQRLARIGLDGLNLRLNPGDQFVLEAPPVIGPGGMGVGRRAHVARVDTEPGQPGTRIVGLAVSGITEALIIAGAVELVVPVDAVNRIVGHQLAHDADQVFLHVRRTHIQRVIAIHQLGRPSLAIGIRRDKPLRMRRQGGVVGGRPDGRDAVRPAAAAAQPGMNLDALGVRFRAKIGQRVKAGSHARRPRQNG